MIDEEALHLLRTIGYAPLDPLDDIRLLELLLYTSIMPVYTHVHVPLGAIERGAQPIPRGLIPEDVECMCWPTAAAIAAPHLFERALELTDTAAAYLGRDPPVMYSANAFFTRPGPLSTRPDIQEFHVDRDDDRFLAMFTFLTDVLSVEDGPQELTGPDGIVRRIFGRAGTVFLADTSRLHRGLKPQSHERGLHWFRFGVSDHPPAGVWDKITAIPAAAMGDRYPTDPRLRESIKLLVAPP